MSSKNCNQVQMHTVTTNPLASGILQRQCATCGQHTIAGGECEDCHKNYSSLQSHGNFSHPFPEQGLASVQETGFNYDFSQIPVQRMEQSLIQLSINSINPPLPEKSEKNLQFQEMTGQLPDVTLDEEAQIDALKGNGQPLSESARNFMEPRFGYDFSQVRIHTDTQSAKLANRLNARAFTVDKDIAFATQQYAPETDAGKRLLAHELTHVVQQNAGHKLQKFHSLSADVISRQESVTASTEFMEQGWEQINEMGILYQETGTYLRDRPLPEGQGSTIIRKLPQNTKVFILKHHQKSRWYAVTAIGEKGGGEFGYIADWLVWRKLPEPNVEVYKIKSGDAPIEIAALKYPEFDTWGKDQRYVVNALVYVNTNAAHNGVGEPGLRKIDNDVTASWFTAKAAKDVYIWLPSSTFLRSLYQEVVKKGGGTGSITADLWQTVKEGLKKLAYGAAFIGGLVHGFVKSLYDTLVGIAKMAIDVLVSIFTGNVLQDAKELWDAISQLTWEDIKNALGAWADEWHAKLISSSPWVAGHAHGYLTGYVMAEAAMLLISAGTLAEVKAALWNSRLGKAIQATKGFQKLAQGIAKIEKAGGKAKTVLDAAKAAIKASKPGKILSEAHQWAAKVLLLPKEILENLSLKAIEQLKTIPVWAQRQISLLGTPAKKILLGCASPCLVNLKAIWRRLEKIVEVQNVLVRGFRNAGELVERVGNLRNRLKKIKFKNVQLDDVQIGLRGSSVTGVSSKGGEFRWLADPQGLRASDVDFFFTSPKLEKKLDSLGEVFKPDGRLAPEVLEKLAPEVGETLNAFAQTTTKQLGRKADAILLRQSLADSLKAGEHIIFK